MTEAVVLRYAVLPGVLVVGLAFAAVVLGRRRPALRHRAVVLGLGAASLLPFLAGLAPAPLIWTVPQGPRAALTAIVGAGAPAERDSVAPPTSVEQLARPSDRRAGSGAPAPRRPSDEASGGSLWWLAGLAAAGSALVGARRVLGAVLLARLARRASPYPAVTRDARRLARRLGVRRRVEVMLSEEVAIPVTWGFLRPRIALPAAASRWPVRRRTAVLLHELAHVLRRDALGQRIVDIAETLYWWNPFVWWLGGVARGDAELASDALTVDAGVAPTDYARELLAVVRAARGRLVPVAALPLGGVALSRRIEAVCRADRGPGTPSRAAAAVAVALALVPAGVLAAFRVPAAGPAEPAAAPAGTSGLHRPAVREATSPRADTDARSREAPWERHGPPAPSHPERSAALDPSARVGDGLASPSSKQRERAVRALRAREDPAAPALLTAALEDPADHVRQAAAETLGARGDAVGVPALVRALGDDDEHVRQAAAGALGDLGDPRAVTPLARALSDPNEHVRQVAAGALGRIGPPAASELAALVAAGRDADEHVRQAAIDALGDVGDAAAVPALLAALDDRDSFVRRSARNSLAELRRAGQTP